MSEERNTNDAQWELEEEHWSEFYPDEVDEMLEELRLERADEDDKPQHEEIMELANEHAWMFIRGSRSGTVVTDLPSGSITREGQVPPIPTRDAALDGRRSILLYHAGGTRFAQGRELLTRLHAKNGASLGLGVSVSIPRHSAKKIADVFDCSVAALRIADPEAFWFDQEVLQLASTDPETYTHQQTGIAAARRAARLKEFAPYLHRLSDNYFIDEVVEAQRAAGANLILTSGRALSTSHPTRSIENLIQEGDHVHSLLSTNERMALNITLPLDFITNESLCDALLAELLEREQFDVWHVRGQWRNNEDGAVLKDPTALKFYKNLSNLAEEEGRVLLLPQSGLTGWYFLAHGARGFGTGTSMAQQAFLQHRPFARQPGIPNVQRIFERALLHPVEFTFHLSLRDQPKYVACDCRWCEAIDATQVYNRTTSGWHTLYNHGALTASARGSDSTGGRRAAVRKILRRAQAFRNDQNLLGKNDPKHLSNWSELL
ncbi:hypothetical protein AB0J90_33525 [Micromonospora sp. NPDC049523]|uniref:hypothetical protein n=1 Tax=Micromonospora sp. NPDC049523 TaxID=3155921 RepID=UPI00343F75A1